MSYLTSRLIDFLLFLVDDDDVVVVPYNLSMQKIYLNTNARFNFHFLKHKRS